MTATYFHQKFGVATGTLTTASIINLPLKGHLTVVSVGTDGTAQGPGYVAIFFGTQADNVFIALNSGTVRGDANYPGADPVTWTGSVSLETNLSVPVIALQFRNDTGSTLPFVVTYCVEDR